jgi:hypothetical protein
MKILSVIVGLALTAGGVYLAYDTFMLFDDLETLRLGLLLGASFLAMTVGLYLFLLPLAMKPKAKKKKRMVQETVVELETNDEDISETEALNVIQANSDDRETSIEETIDTPLEMVEEAMHATQLEDLFNQENETKAFDVIKEEIHIQPKHADLAQTLVMPTFKENIEHEVDGDTVVMPSFNEALEVESNQTDDRLFTAKIFNDTLDFETKHELRVIGIESFGSQRILKKLQPDSELKLSYKQKKGLNLAQVTYQDKVIGYVSRLEMNHLNKSLDQLIRVTPGDIVTDGRKVIRFSVQLYFKDEEKQNA